jgi:ADP-ribosyl-[dinitrogen reductase] hydrolase
MDTRARFRGCLLGLACGDAVGTTLEFKPRGSFAPITDMVGGGPFHLAPGQWTDDTSMALCLATSLVEKQAFDARDQMDRYVRWLRDGYLSSTGTCFDIGGTTVNALQRYQASGEPYSGSTDPRSAGNGSLMRLAPVALFTYPNMGAALFYARESSRTTHGAAEALAACRLFAAMLCRALAGLPRAAVLLDHPAAARQDPPLSPRLESIAAGDYHTKQASGISGSGYVVDCLEAALWSFATTESFSAAILRAANLGDDADTTAAVCGQIAGAFYGIDGIPAPWLKKLTLRAEIERLADALHDHPRPIAS